MIDLSSHIATLDAIDEASPRAPSDVMAAVAALNAGMMLDSVGEQREDVALGLPDKLAEWLDKLITKVRAIAAKLEDVASFSVTVGTPFTVSVSVTFARPQHN
jgi:hypothetical protein